MQIFEKIKFHLLEEGRDDMLKLHESLCLRMRQLKIANAIGRYSKSFHNSGENLRFRLVSKNEQSRNAN